MIHLDHTIVEVSDPDASARFLSEMLGLSPPERVGPFAVVRVGPTSLDFMETDDDVHAQHYAFVVSEAEFDAIFFRIEERGLPFWSDPDRRHRGEINRWDGGRGVYWEDPDGHLLEIITRPYGSGGTTTDAPHPLTASVP